MKNDLKMVSCQVWNNVIYPNQNLIQMPLTVPDVDLLFPKMVVAAALWTLIMAISVSVRNFNLVLHHCENSKWL